MGCCFIEIAWFVKDKVCNVLKIIQLLYVYIYLDITVAPSSVSALYTLANFTCGGTGDILSWTVGGNSLTDPSNQDREISVTTNNISVDVWSSVLTIRALPINDGIGIQCSVISLDSFNFQQEGVTLTVKGILALTCVCSHLS